MGELVDLWSTEPEKRNYSQEAFYTKSVDDKGHSAYLRVPVPPYLGAEVAELIASRRFPYRSPQDFARDAVYHRLHFLGEFSGNLELKRMVEFEIQMIERAQAMDTINRQKQMVEQVEELFRLAVEASDSFALFAALDQAEKDAAVAVEPYRSQVQTLIDRYRRIAEKK